MINKLRNKLNCDIHLKEVLTGSAITFVLKLFGMLMGYILILIISREYGAKGTGVYNMVISIIVFFTMVSSLGFNVSILRYVGQFNQSTERYKLKLLYRYSIMLVVPFSIILSLFLFLFSHNIAVEIFDNAMYKSTLQVAAIIIPFMTILTINVEFIRGMKNLRVSEFLRSVLVPTITIILLLFIPAIAVSELQAIYSFGIAVIISSFIAFIFIYKKIRNIKVESYNNLSIKELLITSFPMMITSIATFTMGNVSLVMIEIFMPTDQVGIFSVCLKISMLISLVLIVVNTISAPKFAEVYWDKQYVKLQIIMNQSSKLILFTSVPLSMGLIFFSENILQIFGDEFIQGVYVLQLLILAQVINAGTGSVGVFLNMTGHQEVLRNITLVALLSILLLNYFLIPLYGMEGAAFSFIVSTIILNVIPAIYVKYKLHYRTYYLPKILRKN